MSSVRSADDYFDRLRDDPELAAEMSERQRSLGYMPNVALRPS